MPNKELTSKKKFSTLVRMPYQEAIRIILRTIDYHNRMALEDSDNRDFHMQQSVRLRQWMVDMKDFIHKNEEDINYEWKNSQTQRRMENQEEKRITEENS